MGVLLAQKSRKVAQSMAMLPAKAQSSLELALKRLRRRAFGQYFKGGQGFAFKHFQKSAAAC